MLVWFRESSDRVGIVVGEKTWHPCEVSENGFWRWWQCWWSSGVSGNGNTKNISMVWYYYIINWKGNTVPCKFLNLMKSRGSSVVELWIHDRKVVVLSPGRSGGRINSLFQFHCQFSAWLIWHLFHPCVTAVTCERSWSFCWKCRWQLT